jgi:RNA polymerase sigma factor (sigma-70 family)
MKFRKNYWTGTQQGKALLTELYEDFSADLMRYSEKMTGNAEEAKDISSMAFLKLMQQKGPFENRRSIRAFLFTVANNLCIDYLRKSGTAKRNQQTIWRLYLENSTQDTPVDTGKRTAQIKKYLKEIEALPKGCAQVFKLYYFEELKNREIAKHLGITEKTVRNQLYKARLLIKKPFAPETSLRSKLPDWIFVPVLLFMQWWS